MKKIKRFIALLASLCVGATAAGLVGCTDGTNSGNGPPDTTLDPGTNPGTNPGTDPGGEVIPEDANVFTVKAVDNNSNPVADAYFNIGYSNGTEDVFITSDGKINSERSKALILKTNENGIATFWGYVDTDKNYKLYLADPNYITLDGTTPSIPRGYVTNFGAGVFYPIFTEENGNYSVTANFKVDFSWSSLFDSTNNLKYSRYYADYTDENVTESYSPYVKNAVANQPNYFTFGPYRAPMPDTTNQTIVDMVTQKGREAASGKYRISWEANNPSADVVLTLYSFAGGDYFQQNDDGSPTETFALMHTGSPTTDTATLQSYYTLYSHYYGSEAVEYAEWLTAYKAKFSGANHITMELSSDDATGFYSLAFTASVNCKVTIKVERIGDGPIWTSKEIAVAMPENEPQAETQKGRVIDAPLSSNTVVVKGSDGYYHLNSANGAKLYVQLIKTTRVNNIMSMAQLADTKNTEGSSRFVITEDEYDDTTKRGVHYSYIYNDVVLGYAELANDDGLYPVNDLLKKILLGYCTQMLNYSLYGDNYWVAACQYYGEEADGSKDRPYDLVLTENNVKNEVPLKDGSAWVSFKPAETGYYEFEYNVPGCIEANGRYFVEIEAQTEFKFEVTGEGNSIKLGVYTIADSANLRYYSKDGGDAQIWYGTESNPLSVNGIGVYMVTIDHSAYNLPLTVDIKFVAQFLTGEYILHVAGGNSPSVKIKVEDGYVAYDGTALSLSNTDSTLIQLDDANDGTFFIWFEKVN